MLTRWVLIIVATVALLGAVVAWAASITVGGTNKLGSGSVTVVAPTGVDGDAVEVTDVEWLLNLGGTCGDNSKVSLVKVTMKALSTSTQFDTIRFQLTGSSGVLARSGNQFDGTTYDGVPGHTFDWDLTAAPTTPAACVSASAITGFHITVVDEAP